MTYYSAPVVVRQRRVSQGHVIVAWVFCVLTGFYLLPWAIAATRDKRASISILLVNLFLGWTLAGWVWALVWSCLTDPEDRVAVAYVQPYVAMAPVYQAPPPQYQPYPHPAPRALPPPPQQQYQPQQQPYQPDSAPRSAPSAGATAYEPTRVLPELEADPWAVPDTQRQTGSAWEQYRS